MARLSRYRSPARADGAPGFADWVRELRRANASGVYVIRDVRTSNVLYVGSSRTGRLYGTLTRHFQAWSPSFFTDGVTYDRHTVEVAVAVTDPEDAPARERALIRRLCPLHNSDGVSECDVPF